MIFHLLGLECICTDTGNIDRLLENDIFQIMAAFKRTVFNRSNRGGNRNSPQITVITENAGADHCNLVRSDSIRHGNSFQTAVKFTVY